jgi:hypothetical protein
MNINVSRKNEGGIFIDEKKREREKRVNGISSFFCP